jgi:ribonuclease R
MSSRTPAAIRKSIVDFLHRAPEAMFKAKDIAHALGLRGRTDYTDFKEILDDLVSRGSVKQRKKGYYSVSTVPHALRGVLEVTRGGFGFVQIDGEAREVFIPARAMRNALDGDRVEIALSPKKARPRQEGARAEGEVLRVIERAHSTLVGTLERHRRTALVTPDDTRYPPIALSDSPELTTASSGEKVVVRIDSWGEAEPELHGTVLEVLGPSGELAVELRSVLREFKLDIEFPADVVDETDALPSDLAKEAIHGRLDLRDQLCFTIDPQDAKDFDDAVSLTVLPDGTHRLGVHIADVSYYVREGTPLDAEALRRGTSVYLPHMVIPMLPEKLSNQLCSLRPGEDRLTFSVMMDLSSTGTLHSYTITPSVIRSRRRFSYEDAHAILAGESAELIGSTESDIVTALRQMHDLSSHLRSRRKKEGSIDFETAEIKFTLDDKGFPVGLQKKKHLETHWLIEEFMLLANKVVAKHIGFVRSEDHERPFIYRVHDAPDPERIRELASFVQQFGFSLNVQGGVSSKALQKLLDQVRGSEIENVINEVALRAMAKAIYSERNIGHYGLAFAHYAHFTSPIRRYPDLIIHRLLKEYAVGISSERRQAIKSRLPAIAKRSSERERVALEAERESTKVYQIEYMKRHLGDELTGVISGITRFGMFIEVHETLAEGMIHVRDMEDDYYEYDAGNYSLVGRSSGRRFRLGDTLHVKVLRVNPDRREIDFCLVQEPKKPSRAGRKRRP